MALNLYFSRAFFVADRSSLGHSFSALSTVSVVSLLPSSRLQRTTERPIRYCRCDSIDRYRFTRNSTPIDCRSVHSSSIREREHTPPGFTPFHPAVHLRLQNEQEAEEFLHYLYKPERDILYKVLRSHQKKMAGGGEMQDDAEEASPISKQQMKLLFLCNSLPFVGFGLLDNLIMIVAGEYIDSTMGIIFGLSTMAAAGFGNILSDIAGVGLAHNVEIFVAKFFNVRPPPLSAEQWDSSRARWTSNVARAFGLTVGCLVGMFPLLFFDESEKQERKMQAKLHHSQELEDTPVEP